MIYAIVNQKGGVGKTTTTINLGAYLARSGKRVLLVDMDPQGNTTSGVGIHTERLSANIYHVFASQVSIVDAIYPTIIDNLHLLPADQDLAAIEVELGQDNERSYYLKYFIKDVLSAYDYILVDCPPALGVLTLNSLAAAEEVIIPLQCEYFALEGLSRLLGTLQRVQQDLNPQLSMSGILLTMYDRRTSLSKEIEREAKQHFDGKLFRSYIPRNVRLSEAPSHGLPILTYAPSSKGARAYESLAKEIIKHHEKR
jgi:chromosome partitioning protein